MRERMENSTITYRIRKAVLLLLLACAGVVAVRAFSERSRAAASEACVVKADAVGAARILADNATEITPTETLSPTPTPMTEEHKSNLRSLAAERYALGVILAGMVSLGILIVLFRYWARRSGGKQD